MTAWTNVPVFDGPSTAGTSGDAANLGPWETGARPRERAREGTRRATRLVPHRLGIPTGTASLLEIASALTSSRVRLACRSATSAPTRNVDYSRHRRCAAERVTTAPNTSPEF